MDKLRVAATLVLAVGGAMLARTLAAVPVYADHTSRDRILSETGVEVILFALVVAAALVAIVAFVVGILWWERQDEDTYDSEQPN